MNSPNTIPPVNSIHRLERPYGWWLFTVIILETLLGLYLIVNPSTASQTISIMGMLILVFFSYAACIMYIIPKMRAITPDTSRNPESDESYRAEAVELEKRLESHISLFWKNVDDCPRLLTEPVHFRHVMDKLTRDLEKEVLAEPITSPEEHLSKLKRAETLIEYTIIEVTNLIKQLYGDQVPDADNPHLMDIDQKTEDPANNYSPSSG